MATKRTRREWADVLAEGWEQRARSASRDLYVASHPGWDDPATWERYARSELDLFLTNLDPEVLRTWDVLEIGCGSGRLVPFLRPAVRSYTGFDIAPSMVAAAEERCRGLHGVRFFRGDGLAVPAPARDRQYHLVLAVAVFIHCPLEVIAANVSSAWSVVAPGGQLRLQVVADPDDPTGIAAPAAPPTPGARPTVETDVAALRASLSDEEARLAREDDYLGHAFGYREVEPFLVELNGGEVALYRGDRAAIYGLVRKPAGRSRLTNDSAAIRRARPVAAPGAL